MLISTLPMASCESKSKQRGD